MEWASTNFGKNVFVNTRKHLFYAIYMLLEQLIETIPISNIINLLRKRKSTLLALNTLALILFRHKIRRY